MTTFGEGLSDFFGVSEAGFGFLGLSGGIKGDFYGGYEISYATGLKGDLKVPGLLSMSVEFRPTEWDAGSLRVSGGFSTPIGEYSQRITVADGGIRTFDSGIKEKLFGGSLSMFFGGYIDDDSAGIMVSFSVDTQRWKSLSKAVDFLAGAMGAPLLAIESAVVKHYGLAPSTYAINWSVNFSLTIRADVINFEGITTQSEEPAGFKARYLLAEYEGSEPDGGMVGANLGGALADARMGGDPSHRSLGGALADERREEGSSASERALGSAGSGVASGVMEGVGHALGVGVGTTIDYDDRIQRVVAGYEGVNATFSYPYYDDAIIRAAMGYQGVNVTVPAPVQSVASTVQAQVRKVLANADPLLQSVAGKSDTDGTNWQGTDGKSHWGSVKEYKTAVSRGEVEPQSSTPNAQQMNDYQKQKSNGGGASNKPVLLDLDGNGIKITDFDKSSIFMDGGDGLKHRTAWAGAGDGVLFFDAGDDNQITEQREYVFTEWDPTATGDLEAIRSVFDSNGDGKLTAADAEFAKFKVMVTNADGSTTVKTLAELGITEINLTANAVSIELPDGSVITGQTTFTRANGTVGTVANTSLVAEAAGHRVVETVGSDGVNRVPAMRWAA